jgi:hypothetical protein
VSWKNFSDKLEEKGAKWIAFASERLTMSLISEGCCNSNCLLSVISSLTINLKRLGLPKVTAYSS